MPYGAERQFNCYAQGEVSAVQIHRLKFNLGRHGHSANFFYHKRLGHELVVLREIQPSSPSRQEHSKVKGFSFGVCFIVGNWKPPEKRNCVRCQEMAVVAVEP